MGVRRGVRVREEEWDREEKKRIWSERKRRSERREVSVRVEEMW